MTECKSVTLNQAFQSSRWKESLALMLYSMLPPSINYFMVEKCIFSSFLSDPQTLEMKAPFTDSHLTFPTRWVIRPVWILLETIRDEVSQPEGDTTLSYICFPAEAVRRSGWNILFGGGGSCMSRSPLRPPQLSGRRSAVSRPRRDPHHFSLPARHFPTDGTTLLRCPRRPFW